MELAEPVPSGPSSQQLSAWAREHQLIVGGGLVELDADGRLFNAYVVALPSRPASACAARVDLATRVPWLSRARVVPLVESRGYAIVRSGSVGVAADGDGSVVLLPSSSAGRVR